MVINLIDKRKKMIVPIIIGIKFYVFIHNFKVNETFANNHIYLKKPLKSVDRKIKAKFS
jgi:hypothetical protein